ncbi:MAG: terminus macrodomain insulation protein YfbV [Pseudomonadota bacterium]|nr:terminus macrodomain insulation protein YfbV [Pseudomonadota bacterium]
MSQSVITLLRDGQDYMNTWPVKRELYAFFPECRVVSATKLAIKAMPPLAIVAAGMMFNVLGSAYLPQAMAIGLFFISLPLQGLLWLGHRSNQTLPPQIKSWYQEVHRKMAAEGCELQAMRSQPKYRELAATLKTAFSELDRVFTQKWFN